jgi:hypothetical protein
MFQAKFSIGESELNFLNGYSNYGFKDKSEMVRKALDKLKRELIVQQLEKSAALYTEIYENDLELQELANSSLNDWPE